MITEAFTSAPHPLRNSSITQQDINRNNSEKAAEKKPQLNIRDSVNEQNLIILTEK